MAFNISKSFIDLSKQPKDFCVFCHYDKESVSFFKDAKSSHEKMHMKVLGNEISSSARQIYHHLNPILNQKSCIAINLIQKRISLSIDDTTFALFSRKESDLNHLDALQKQIDNVVSFYTRFPDKKKQRAWRFLHTNSHFYASTPARAFLKRAIIFYPHIVLDTLNMRDFLEGSLSKSWSVSPADDSIGEQSFFPSIEDIMREIEES